MQRSNGINDRAPALRRAHAVIKQRTRLAYAPPELVLLPQDDLKTGERHITFHDARIAQNLSIEELARRSRISPSTIYRIECGKTRPRLHVVHALSVALGVTPREITEFREIVAPDPFWPRLS